MRNRPDGTPAPGGAARYAVLVVRHDLSRFRQRALARHEHTCWEHAAGLVDPKHRDDEPFEAIVSNRWSELPER